MPEISTLPILSSTVSYWRMEGNSNDSKDSNNGTDTSMTYSSTNGKFGQHGVFSGSGYINIGNPANLKITGASTLHAWVKTSGNGSILSIWSWNGSDRKGVTILSNNGLQFESAVSGNTLHSTYEVVVGGTINDGLWHMVDGTQDGANLNIYVDGINVGTIAWAHAPAFQTDVFYIGARYFAATGQNIITGSIDDVAVFNVALTPNQILGIYQEQSGAHINFEI